MYKMIFINILVNLFAITLFFKDDCLYVLHIHEADTKPEMFVGYFKKQNRTEQNYACVSVYCLKVQ